MKFVSFVFNHSLYSYTSSFSVIHLNVDIKKNVEKDSTTKSPGGHEISRQKHVSRVACDLIAVN